MAEAFLMVDANKDKMITKKEGEDAATSNFARKEEEETCDSCPNCEEKCSKWYLDMAEALSFEEHEKNYYYCDIDGDQQLDIKCDCGVCKVFCALRSIGVASGKFVDC